MKHYLIIGRTDLSDESLLHWSGPEQSLEHAERCFREFAWETVGMADDKEGREQAEDEGMGPVIEQCFVSDTPIKDAQ